jgi:hypothetical protein
LYFIPAIANEERIALVSFLYANAPPTFLMELPRASPHVSKNRIEGHVDIKKNLRGEKINYAVGDYFLRNC